MMEPMKSKDYTDLPNIYRPSFVARKMDLKILLSGFVIVFGILVFLTLPGSLCADGGCPNQPSGGGQSISATVKKTSTSCPVTDGMYVRTYTTLRLDAIATAFGQCQVMVMDCVGGCHCIPGPLQERTINHIYAWVDVVSQYMNGTYNVGNIFGKYPNGTTAFWQVLDSTQPNSTGPLTYGTGSAGSYLLHFQANINTTNCNILPSITPITDVMVYARTTLHMGQRTAGSLIGATNLPNSGTGYYHYWGRILLQT